ncbi:hypothetical protein D3C81_2143280 [compost metagenome]
MVADQRNKEAGKRGDQGDRDGHHHRRFQLGGHRQRRTDAKHLQRDRVIVKQRPQQDPFNLFGISHFSALLHGLSAGMGQSRTRPTRN